VTGLGSTYTESRKNRHLHRAEQRRRRRHFHRPRPADHAVHHDPRCTARSSETWLLQVPSSQLPTTWTMIHLQLQQLVMLVLTWCRDIDTCQCTRSTTTSVSRHHDTCNSSSTVSWVDHLVLLSVLHSLRQYHSATRQVQSFRPSRAEPSGQTCH